MREKAEANGNLIGNITALKIRKASRTLPQNSSETVTNETKNIGLDREMP